MLLDRYTGLAESAREKYAKYYATLASPGAAVSIATKPQSMRALKGERHQSHQTHQTSPSAVCVCVCVCVYVITVLCHVMDLCVL